MKSTFQHPEWATKHKNPGTELRLINGRYYLYKISSRWNAEKKRSQKITGKMLGKITEKDGFVASAKKDLSACNAQVKEYGATFLVENLLKDSVKPLQKYFPNAWQCIIAAALFRLIYQSPLKNMEFYFSQSFLSEKFKISLSAKSIAHSLASIGGQRDKITAYFSEFVKPGEHVLVDVTTMHSQSKELSLARKGYNSQGDFDPQVNLLLIFSQTFAAPVYYRMVPGNVRDVKAFTLSLKESHISDAILIADKGFYSNKNVQQLDDGGLKYVLPLRKNSSLINYENLEKPQKTGMDGFFKYKNRYIWFCKYAHNGKWVIVFLDSDLRNAEEKDYLDRIKTHPEEYSLERFNEKSKLFGTFAILTNLSSRSEEEIYGIYKSRTNIECAANTLKNLLHADRSYMRNEQSMEGWMFINFIALVWYYTIYRLLVKNELLAKFSPKDLLIRLTEVRKIKIQDQWHLAEFPSSTSNLLKKLSLPIT